MRRAALLVAFAVFAAGCDSRQPAPTATPTTVVATQTLRLQPKDSWAIALRSAVTVIGPTATPARLPDAVPRDPTRLRPL